MKHWIPRLAFWLVIVLFSAMLGLVPSGAEAHPGHQANPGITADPAGQVSAPRVLSLRGLSLTDSTGWAEAVSGFKDLLSELTAPDSGSTDRLCNSSCCSGMGCCPSALPLTETFADRFPSGSDTAARIAGPGPDAVPEALPEPPRSFV
jgi:hypothetical protein